MTSALVLQTSTIKFDVPFHAKGVSNSISNQPNSVIFKTAIDLTKTEPGIGFILLAKLLSDV